MRRDNRDRRKRHYALLAVGYFEIIFSHTLVFIFQIDERNKEMIKEYTKTQGRIKGKKIENRREVG
jgi:hypothetical protein